MIYYSIHILGKAVPKGRPRFTRTGHVYTPKTTKDWETKVRQSWTAKYPDTRLEGPLKCYIYVKGAHTLKKDVDNIAKSILDGLNGVAFNDDSQVYELYVSKIPGVSIDNVTIAFREVSV